MNMIWIIRRFLHSLLVVISVTSLVFLILRCIPGDPVDAILGENALPSSRESLRKDLKLDLSWEQQFIDSWKSLLQGSLGESLQQREPVVKLLKERIPPTIELASLALLLALMIAVPLGLLSAYWNNRFTNALSTAISCLGMSIPSFFLAPLLVLFFSVHLGWFPVSERTGLLSYILPSLTLGLLLACFLFQVIQSHAKEILREPFIQSAYAKGLTNYIVLTKHVLKNVMIPLITVLSLQLGALINGVIIIETIFDWPGIGELLFLGIQNRDYPVVQACVLFIAVSYISINTLTDLAYQKLNPRIRSS